MLYGATKIQNEKTKEYLKIVYFRSILSTHQSIQLQPYIIHDKPEVRYLILAEEVQSTIFNPHGVGPKYHN